MADSNMLYRRTQQATLKELFGNPLYFGDCSQFRGQSIQQAFMTHYREQGVPDWQAKARAAYDCFLKNGAQLFHEMLASEEIGLFEGAKHTIEGLLANHIPVAVISNSPPEFLCDLMLPALLGPELAEKIIAVGCEYDDRGKPETDTCERTLDLLADRGLLPRDAARDSVYFVGDSAAHDMEVAHRMGFTPVLYGADAMEIARRAHEHDPEAITPAMHRFLHAEHQAALQAIFDVAEQHHKDAQDKKDQAAVQAR